VTTPLEFAEAVQLFALSTGGGQFILAGKSLTYGDAYSGSGYVDGASLAFSFFSGLLPGMLQGTLTLATGERAPAPSSTPTTSRSRT
jgi:hypothetical protein